MKRKRHTPEEIIKKLREAGGLLAGGKNVEEVCRALGTSVATYQRWKSQYGGGVPPKLEPVAMRDLVGVSG